MKSIATGPLSAVCGFAIWDVHLKSISSMKTSLAEWGSCSIGERFGCELVVATTRLVGHLLVSFPLRNRLRFRHLLELRVTL